jgi:hypothetical protein
MPSNISGRIMENFRGILNKSGQMLNNMAGQAKSVAENKFGQLKKDFSNESDKFANDMKQIANQTKNDMTGALNNGIANASNRSAQSASNILNSIPNSLLSADEINANNLQTGQLPTNTAAPKGGKSKRTRSKTKSAKRKTGGSACGGCGVCGGCRECESKSGGRKK